MVVTVYPLTGCGRRELGWLVFGFYLGYGFRFSYYILNKSMMSVGLILTTLTLLSLLNVYPTSIALRTLTTSQGTRLTWLLLSFLNYNSLSKTPNI